MQCFCTTYQSHRALVFPVSDPAYPRIEAARSLIHVISKVPKVAKTAVSALVDLGQSIFPSVTEEETAMLLKGTLAQEVYVRNACLQALQVRSHSEWHIYIAYPLAQ